jgi:pimeloyl-ACP methyl ester carboxylesterase
MRLHLKEVNVPETVEPTDKQLTANGLTFHYVDWGTAGRPPMLLLHGFNQTAHSWDEFCPRVCRDYHVRAFDQRGHGDTQWAPDKDYSRDAMVRDIAAIVRELVLPPFVLIGMSMGGANAMTYAARYPTTVKALVLVDVGPEIKQEGVDNIRRLVGPQEWPSLEAAVADVQRFNPRRSLDNIRQRLSHSMRQLPSGAWTWKVDEVFRDPNRPRQRDSEGLWEAVRRLQCPTLLVNGAESDILAPDAAQRMVATIPRGQLATVPGAGHSVMGDNPEEFYQAVKTFLDGLA